MASVVFTVEWDWGNDGNFASSGDDITSYVREIRTLSGFDDDPLAHVASIGRMELLLNNADQRFSPANASSPYAGMQWINAPIRVRASIDGGAAFTVWRGYTVSVDPAPGAVYGPRTARVICEDLLGILARAPLALPAQQNLTMSQLLNLIGAEVFKTDFATGTITLNALPTAGETVTVGERVYTFAASVGGTAYAVLIGASTADTARNLAAAINDDADAAGGVAIYGSGTLKSIQVSAAADGDVVIVTALARGTLGNTFPLATTAANVALSGTTLAGGSDGPAGLTDYVTGKRTFDFAADQWHADRTTALRAWQDVIESEFGYGWVSRDGKLTTWDKDREFELPGETVAAAFDEGQFFTLDGALGDLIINRVAVSYEPRGTEVDQVLARANNTIAVPGKTFGTRWNREVGYPNSGEAAALDAGVKLIRLPFVQGDTGNVVGASEIITPRRLTDFRVNDARDLMGYDYTEYVPPFVTVSVVVTGSGVECAFSNAALDTLYVHEFQVRGTAIISYDPQQVIREDATSITTYQRRALTVTLPLPSGEDYAEQIAYYLVGRYKDPAYRVRRMVIRDATRPINDVDPLAIQIGDTVAITEAQTATDHTFIVRGIALRVANGGRTVELRWQLKRVDEVTYWIINDAAYGVLGETTRIGL